jgi:hypothetical protein
MTPTKEVRDTAIKWTAKGKVYGGIVHFPVHPKADMHGLVRFVMRTRDAQFVRIALESYGIRTSEWLWNCGIFSESKSAVEQLATEHHYGEVMVCSLVEAYLSADKYSRIPKGMKNV